MKSECQAVLSALVDVLITILSCVMEAGVYTLGAVLTLKLFGIL